MARLSYRLRYARAIPSSRPILVAPKGMPVVVPPVAGGSDLAELLIALGMM